MERTIRSSSTVRTYFSTPNIQLNDKLCPKLGFDTDHQHDTSQTKKQGAWQKVTTRADPWLTRLVVSLAKI